MSQHPPWKRYVDATCCILRKDDVDGLLHQHTPNHNIHHGDGGGWISPDTKITRRMVNSALLCTVNRRTRTGTSTLGLIMKRGTVRCLYDHARCIAQQGQNLRKEEILLMKACVGNGYPRSFIRSASAAKPPRENDQEGEDGPPTVTSLT